MFNDQERKCLCSPVIQRKSFSKVSCIPLLYTAIDSGAQVVFSSVLPVKGKEFESTSQIWQINK